MIKTFEKNYDPKSNRQWRLVHGYYLRLIQFNVFLLNGPWYCFYLLFFKWNRVNSKCVLTKIHKGHIVFRNDKWNLLNVRWERKKKHTENRFKWLSFPFERVSHVIRIWKIEHKKKKRTTPLFFVNSFILCIFRFQ